MAAGQGFRASVVCFEGHTIQSLFEEQVLLHGSSRAVVYGDTVLTYSG